MAIDFVGFTADCRIVGTIPLADDRLSDMLNSVARVVIRDAEVEDVDLGPQEGGQVMVPCGELLVVGGTGRRGLESRRRRTEVRHVQIGLGRYTVTGSIHVLPRVDGVPADDEPDALLVGRDLLVPITDAKVRYLRAGKPYLEQWETVLVNRARASWIKVLEDDYREEEPAEEELEEGPVKTRYVKDFTGTVAE
jgi:hypothetical protein